MRTKSFNTNDLKNCRCVLIDENGGTMDLILRDIKATCDIGCNVNMQLDCEYNPLYEPSLLGLQEPKFRKNSLAVRKVIYNPPATVILWKDGTKTVVKCDERDEYNPDYGFALCYMKKALGNTSRALNDALHKERIKV